MSGESSADGAESPVSTGDLLLGRYRVTERLAEGGHSVILGNSTANFMSPPSLPISR
jgi:hypothetical protein